MGTCLEPTSAESFEGIDDPLHKIRQFAEGWKNRPTLEDFNISKSYIEGRMYVLVFFCIAGELDEYIALFRNRQLAYQRHTEDILFGGWLPSEEVDSAHVEDDIEAGIGEGQALGIAQIEIRVHLPAAQVVLAVGQHLRRQIKA